jgi:hypothetical protein
MKENRLWILIARGLSGEATDKDFEELNRLLKKHPETSFHVAILLNWWKHDSRNGTPDPAVLAALVNRILRTARLSLSMN